MSQSGVYSENKMLWHYVRDGGLPDVPKQVQLILSDLCNQDCSFCAYRMSGYTSNQLFVGDSKAAAYGHNNPQRWIPTERAMSLISEISELGCLAVQFTGGGEPTVHPAHEDIFRKTLEQNLRASLVSNGIKWSEKLINDILPNFDWVRVSIDAGEAGSYARIRRTPAAHWERVWRNVGALATSIKRRGSSCQFGLGFVVTPDSWHEIERFAVKARTSGVHNVRYTAMFSPDSERPFVAIYDGVKMSIDRVRDLYSDASFTVYDNFGSRFDDLKQRAPDYRDCAYQRYTTYIGGDMQAYRCCILAYNKRGKLATGDLTNQRFDDFWRRPERKVDMNNLDARGCERCQFNVKNRQMVEIISNDMPHKEWP